MTGPPGVGKTTLVRAVVSRLAHLHPVGFHTAEIRRAGTRTGFELVGFDGRKSTLAHVDIGGSERVGKYGVDVTGFERFLAGLEGWEASAGLVVIDEIGRMECLAGAFRPWVLRVLGTEVPLLATVALRGGGFIAEVKQRPEIELLALTLRNRDRMAAELPGRFA